MFRLRKRKLRYLRSPKHIESLWMAMVAGRKADATASLGHKADGSLSK